MKELKKRVKRLNNIVYAEIYYNTIGPLAIGNLELSVVKRDFSYFFADPDEKLYLKAQAWADNVIALDKKHGTE